jgi:hypothetical protein
MSTELIISAALAYVALGIGQASSDLDSRRNPLYTVQWALQPSLWMAVAIAVLWPTRHFLRQWHRGQGLLRSFAFGLLVTGLSMTSVTAFFWLCIWTSQRIFDNLALVVALSAVFMIVGSFLVLPIVGLLTFVVGAVLASVLDVIFPKRDTPFQP